jgi:hypothetical protein
MGFWHTGYMEFHEPVGLNGDWKPSPPRMPCSLCGQVFSAEDELRRHRFEAHPLRRPTLFLNGRELGTQRMKITRPIARDQIRVEGAQRIILNGHEISPLSLQPKLAEISNDVCRIVLSKDGIEAEFELGIRVASESDLLGIEEQFTRMAACRRLDTHAVEEFIIATSRFTSANGYCDGICAYFYGLLAKERAADCSLAHETYVAKYATAADELAPYDRNLAHTIGALIEFHFNHFEEAERLCRPSRLGRVSGRFAAWIGSRRGSPAVQTQDTDLKAAALETLVSEWDTERILGWANRPLESIASDLEDIELFLNRDLAEFDRVKTHMLLGELLAATGNVASARDHAKALRHVPAVATWSEALIHALGEDK